jgi:2-polyprenyl-6-methoxyphenol hydroxylase-like FAD-dependent oxidoreductase
MARFDVIVVGAGVAGSMTAALLGRQGFRVLLLEQATFPRPKICGEGLMPAGAEILHRHGLLEDLKLKGARSFSGITLHLPGDLHLDLDFKEVSPRACGWVVPRLSLDDRLASFAADQPGVELCQGFQVRSAHIGKEQAEVTGQHEGRPATHSAHLLVGADGIRSRFHHDFGVLRRRRPSPRFGLSSLYAHLAGTGDRVEVHCSEAGEAYVAPLSEGAARITLLLSEATRRQGRVQLSDYYFHALKRFPKLVERLKTPYPEQLVESTAGVSLQVSQCHGPRLLLVGDAAGAVDPVTGQGMTVALKDAETASDFLRTRLSEARLSGDDLSPYTALRSRYFKPAVEMAQLVLFMVQRPGAARRALRALSRNPGLREKTIRMASKVSGTHALSSRDKGRLFLGF